MAEYIGSSPLADLHRLAGIYEIETLAALADASVAQLRRHQRGSLIDRPLAARLRYLAALSADLAVTHNPAGMRRWWEQASPVLEGRTPAECLGFGWTPDSPDAVALATLVASSAH
jgi:hypothetical protein